MKNNVLKLISASLASLMIAGSFSTYAFDAKLDYSVESGTEQNKIVEDGGLFASSAIFEYNVETAEDIFQETLTANANEASLMEDFDPVMFRGKGTEASPYLISTVEELLSIAVWVNNGAFTDAHYLLENDIDLGGAEWTPIGDFLNSELYTYAFKGTFDGNGKKVSNFKITKPQIYAGFFGLANNATIKNLTVENFNVNIEYAANYMYVGGIVARIRAIGDGETAIIENCHVKNSNIAAKSLVRIYGSGHSGYLHSSENATLTVKNCTTDAKVNFFVNDTTVGGDRSMIRAGGLIGYVGITDGQMRIVDSSSSAVVHTELADGAQGSGNNIHAGGFAGDFSLDSDYQETRSKLVIDSCYSSNMVYAKSDGDAYAGGFSGYFVSSASDIAVTNCHTSSSVYTTSVANISYLGGFSSILGIDNSKSPIGTISFESIYTSGNVVDIKSQDSAGGKITGYIEGNPVFNNCFIMADAVLYSQSNTIKGSKELAADKIPGIVLDAQSAYNLKNYAGFDTDFWKNGTEPYSYPVLIENEFVPGLYNLYYYNDTALNHYENNVNYGSLPVIPDFMPESNYLFSHWSLYPGGSNAFDGNTTITSDTVFFPNNSTEYKSYDIRFSANGEIFYTDSIKYNSNVIFPAAPPKPADALFKYAFSHWSKTEDGAALDESKEIVKGNSIYYAVYKKVETGVWDGISATSFSAGNGTAESPYEISDAYNLAYLAKTVNEGTADEGAYYIITKDIDLGGYEWTPIGTESNPFTGTVIGNGYCVYNFRITDENTLYAGVFGYIKNSAISQLEISGFTINLDNSERTQRYYVGALAAYAVSDATNSIVSFSECYAEGEITVTGKIIYAGGIVGQIEDSDVSFAYIENSYSNVEIIATSSANSTVGGIAGKFESKNIGISCINKCYAVGDVSALSDVASYAGGIVGFLFNDEDWAEVSGVLSEEDLDSDIVVETGAVRNSFSTAKIIYASLSQDSYAGAIYGFKSDIAGVLNCGYDEKNTVITSKNIANDKNVIKMSDVFKKGGVLIVETFRFDTDNIWESTDTLPLLKIFNQIKNVFRINEYALNSDKTILNVELKICYRDVEKYIVMLGAYDERGKMISFESYSDATPSEIKTVELQLGDVSNAVTFTLSVLNPKTLMTIESPITLNK